MLTWIFHIVIVSNGCPDLQAPDNGALACDVWVGGRFCHPFCSEGYSTYYNLPNMLICQENGLWTKREKLSDCVGTLFLYSYYKTI